MGIFSDMPNKEELNEVRARRRFENSIPGVESSDGFDSFDDGFGNDGFNSFDGGFGNDSYGGGNSFGGSPFGGDSFSNDPFGNSFNQGVGGFSNNYDIASNKPEEQGSDWPLALLKSVFSFLKETFGVLKDFSGVHKVRYGQFSFYFGIFYIVVGLIGFFLPFISSTQFIAAGFFSVGVGGFFLLSGNQQVTEYTGEATGDLPYSQDSDKSDVASSDNSFSDTDDFAFPSNFDDPDEEDWNNSVESALNDSNDFDDEEDDFESYTGIEQNQEVEKPIVTPEAILAKIDVSDTPMVSRRYLLDCASPLLEGVNPNYSSVKDIPMDSKEFLSICDWVEQSARITMGKLAIEDVPKVESVKETLFYLKCTLTRPRWFTGNKADQFEKELKSLCSYNKETDTFDEGVTVSSSSVGNRIFLKIMKGETAMVSIKDVLNTNEEFFLDGKHKLPVIWGIDADGKPIINDFNSLTGLFLSGAPRTGKSWAVKSLIAQMMLLNSPTNLQFHFIDPKGPTSDFYALNVPHVRSFNSEIPDILKLLKFLTEDEAKRREKILSETGPGYVNIEDFKKEHPTFELPYVYVVIDEIMSLSANMDKEVKGEFYSYLKAFVTRLPGYGIKLIMIPHLVKNSVVDKSVTDMLPNKIVVKGDARVIEDTLDVKPKDFPYALTHVGDMAVKFADSSSVQFVHSIILGTSNAAYSQFFDFLTELWLKLDKNSFKDSRLYNNLLNGSISLSSFPVLNNILDPDEYKKLQNAILSHKLNKRG